MIPITANQFYTGNASDSSLDNKDSLSLIEFVTLLLQSSPISFILVMPQIVVAQVQLLFELEDTILWNQDVLTDFALMI